MALIGVMPKPTNPPKKPPAWTAITANQLMPVCVVGADEIEQGADRGRLDVLGDEKPHRLAYGILIR